uniref:Synaptic vesicle glycoprotein 2B n=1 Tax=Cacopsylla melanoneura TaxID=428564 RepID=A0A8D9BLM1_9HEMI
MGLDFGEITDATFENALAAAGFGKFHYFLVVLGGFLYAYAAISITVLSFVLPSAQCDFGMSSSDKGWLNASPMLGMVFGSYFWGCLADTQGRKVTLIGALLVDGLCGIASSVAQYYSVFLALRFINGFAVMGTLGICFPYLGEFQPTAYREKVLCWLEMFWTGGIIILPAVAWLLIPLDLRFETPYFLYSSWNLFVTLVSIPSILLALWMIRFPESPKFLFESGEYDQALDVLRMMFSYNTGKEVEEYPVKSLREKPHRMSTVSMTSTKSTKSILRSRKAMKAFLAEIKFQTGELFNKEHRKNTILACLVQFGLTCSYYTLMLWFPELFNRYEKFERLHPGQVASVCDVSARRPHPVNHTMIDACSGHVNSEVFSHTLIIGLACIPSSLAMPLLVHKMGAKWFLVAGLILSAGVAMALFFVQTSTQNLILSCIFEALTGCCISVVYCIMVDLFPTNLRVLAAALSATFGRFGALFGNLMFGFLIDGHCFILICTLAAMLLAAGLFSIFLPSTGKKELD